MMSMPPAPTRTRNGSVLHTRVLILNFLQSIDAALPLANTACSSYPFVTRIPLAAIDSFALDCHLRKVL
jgi:hypothetical protein